MDKIQQAKQLIAKQILDSIENSEFWVTKGEVASNAGVSSNGLYNILGAKTDYTIESLLKVLLERGITELKLCQQ